MVHLDSLVLLPGQEQEGRDKNGLFYDSTFICSSFFLKNLLQQMEKKYIPHHTLELVPKKIIFLLRYAEWSSSRVEEETGTYTAVTT